MAHLYLNTAPAQPLSIDPKEEKEVLAAFQAANPKTEQEAHDTFRHILTTGPLLGKCYQDEVTYHRPRLLAAVSQWSQPTFSDLQA